ncbi:PucR family transcriptional regulator ligand-binding domain-containing protein [Janibacter limosus]|uniref:PucR family transcriptional regulator ligand-binding domain-containing protein n=1 Tax=Janibacter limosus TaxID=53458 RepID=A0AC61U2Y0_9MICO|nr:PucR family transcriptional regulator ligand-binding domain-containing protein [Janibacter limosus]UUZ44359.1 PucR family transcriptional regulator ligand-binding domain-containing protein [Janibacter limosus]
MAPTLRRLIREPALGVTLLTGEEHLDAEVRWVATNEHPDPTPFLKAGDLLLTTGINLPTTTQQVRAYTDRLVRSGAVALGLGLGLGHPSTPRRLISAARRSGLALIEVDEPTPFIAVSKALSDLIAREEHAEAMRTAQTQRELTRAAVRDGTAGVTRTIARIPDGWALVLDRTAAVQHAEPPETKERIADLGEGLERVVSGKVAAASLIDGDEHVPAHTLTAFGRVRGFLVCGTRRRPGGSDRAALGLATTLLAIGDDQQVVGSRRRDAALLRLARQGTVIDPGTPVDLGGAVLASEAVVGLAASGPPGDLRALADELDDLPADNVLTVHEDRRVLAVVDLAHLHTILHRARAERGVLRCERPRGAVPDRRRPAPRRTDHGPRGAAGRGGAERGGGDVRLARTGLSHRRASLRRHPARPPA